MVREEGKERNIAFKKLSQVLSSGRESRKMVEIAEFSNCRVHVFFRLVKCHRKRDEACAYVAYVGTGIERKVSITEFSSGKDDSRNETKSRTIDKRAILFPTSSCYTTVDTIRPAYVSPPVYTRCFDMRKYRSFSNEIYCVYIYIRYISFFFFYKKKTKCTTISPFSRI